MHNNLVRAIFIHSAALTLVTETALAITGTTITARAYQFTAVKSRDKIHIAFFAEFRP